jgi:hypothetical protein
MKKQQPKLRFDDFLQFFPEITLPITLTEESYRSFESNTNALPQPYIDKYLAPFHPNLDDSTTEFLPCFRIPDTHDFIALVYWKAGLLEQEYFIWTLDKENKTVDFRRIAGLFSDHSRILRMVTTIDPDWIFYIIVGESKTDSNVFDPKATKSFTYELLANGKIIET